MAGFAAERGVHTDLSAYRSLLCSTSLLRGIEETQLDSLLGCLDPQLRSYQKDEILLMAGYENRQIGLVLDGQIVAQKNTPNGGNIVMAQMGPGGIFGDVLSGSHSKSPVTVLAAEPCLILYLSYHKIIGSGCCTHAAHSQLLQNLISTISDKYFALDRRVDLLICKSLRSRICLWLLDEAEAHGSSTFTVPFTRAGLADYLGCDRSALSRELGRMRQAGLLETYRGSFKITDMMRLRAHYQEGRFLHE